MHGLLLFLAAGPSAAMVSGPTNPVIASMGVFASASFALTKMKKEVELWEVCHTMIPKVPRAYSKVKHSLLPYCLVINPFQPYHDP